MHVVTKENPGRRRRKKAPVNDTGTSKSSQKVTAPRVFEWTPNGAEVSPLDFSIWGWMDKMLGEMREEKTLHCKSSPACLKKRIDDAIENVKKRINRLIERERGHIEVHKNKMISEPRNKN